MNRVRAALVTVAVAAIVLAAGSWILKAASPPAAPGGAPTAATGAATAPASMNLPKPRTGGGMPLMEALQKRQTGRQFADKKLPPQILSDLLWAAFGVNRPDGKRTAPSAVNWQEIDVYVAMADGLWLFDPNAHDLTLVYRQDIRAATGTQAFVKDAPVNLVFVADYGRMPAKMAESDKAFNSTADTGFISQNVYLYCASEGLATVVRGLVDRPALSKAMGLRESQRVVLAQTVGYPPK